MKQELYYPSKPAIYDSAGRTPDDIYKTPIESSSLCDASTRDQSIHDGLTSAPRTGFSNLYFRAIISSAATAYLQTTV